MIGLDTSVLVRYIMQDDPKQSAKASLLVQTLNDKNPGFVTVVSVIELVCVLSSCYALRRDQVAQALDAMLRTRQLRVQQAEQVLRALMVYGASKADFADCLIERSAAHAGCGQTVTLDVGAAKHAGMTLIE